MQLHLPVYIIIIIPSCSTYHITDRWCIQVRCRVIKVDSEQVIQGILLKFLSGAGGGETHIRAISVVDPEVIWIPANNDELVIWVVEFPLESLCRRGRGGAGEGGAERTGEGGQEEGKGMGRGGTRRTGGEGGREEQVEREGGKRSKKGAVGGRGGKNRWRGRGGKETSRRGGKGGRDRRRGRMEWRRGRRRGRRDGMSIHHLLTKHHTCKPT